MVLSDLAATEPDGQPMDPLGNDGSVNVTVGVPTLSEWGIIIMMLLLLMVGTIAIIRRRQPKMVGS